MKKSSICLCLSLALLASCAGTTPTSSSAAPIASSSATPGSSQTAPTSSSAPSSSTLPGSTSSSSSAEEKKELITNGDFSTGSAAPFSRSDFEGAASTLDVTNVGTEKMLRLAITTPSWGQASPRIEYSHLTLQDKKTYLLSFDAYAEKARTMHVQVGQLLSADPWYKAASAKAIYFDLGLTKETFKWSFTVDGSLGSLLTDESLLMEFGKMSNGAPSDATTVYLDNISLKESDEKVPDTKAPILSVDEKASFFVGDAFLPLTYVHVRDDVDSDLQASVDTAKSKLPSVDANNLITAEPGSYSVTFTATDSAKNTGSVVWNFIVKAKIEAINNFNLAGFKKGNSLGDIPDDDTTQGIVYAANDKTTFSFADHALTVTSVQSATDDDWTATQVFARSLRCTPGGNYELSFDLNSTVDGVIQVATNWVDPVGYPIVKGNNHISLEKYIFEGNYADLTIVFGAHQSIQQPGVNIGPFTAVISNFSFVASDKLPDVEAPIIKLTEFKHYFVGDTFDLLKTVSISDYRDSAPKLEVVAAESTVPSVDADKKLTTAGNYKVVFKGTDATGNSKKFTAFYVVKDKPVGLNNFCFQSLIYGEEGMLSDPTEAFLWNDGNVKVTREVLGKDSLKFTSSQKSTDPWYATQLFFNSLKVEKFGLYKLSYTLTSDVAGTIKLDGASYALKVGDNLIEKTFALEEGGYYHASIQFGKEETGNIGACTITLKGASLVYQKDATENPAWSANGMTVTTSGTDTSIAYTSIPDPFYNVNARIYDFSDKTSMQACVINFTGVAGTKYQFKIEGLTNAVYANTSVKATGSAQKAIIDMTNMTLDQKKELNCLLMFVETVGASGTCVIHSVQYFTKIADAFDTKWRGYGTTVVEKEGTSTISFDSVGNNWWEENAQYSVDSGNITATTTKIVFTFKGEKDKIFLFKVQDTATGGSLESAATATGEVQDFTLDISSYDSASRAGLNLLVVFCKTVGYTGSIAISKIAYL